MKLCKLEMIHLVVELVENHLHIIAILKCTALSMLEFNLLNVTLVVSHLH